MRVLTALLPLVALIACRPPEDSGPSGAPKVADLAARDTPADGSGGAGGGPGTGGGPQGDPKMALLGLGKEDFGLIEAELRCVAGMWKDDATARRSAELGILARYGATEDWVARVRVHMVESEPDVSSRMEELVRRRMAQVCVDGKLSAELLGAAPPTPPTVAGTPAAAAAPVPEAAPTADPAAAPAAKP